MATNLIDAMNNPGQPEYYSRGFYNIVEDHLQWLQDPINSNMYKVSGMEAHRYYGRFYAYLRDVVGANKPEYYYTILRVNNMTSPMQFDENWHEVLIPKDGKIDTLMEKYLAFKAG
ncbi:hypothetical protein TOTORO_00010 [Serratia phage vB_SmaS-Totoro]|nr:hypothetical protein TOTORO_00010 [Serratia phage vB_SmaS-Totoro]